MLKYICQMDTDFTNWLINELQKRDWSQSDLSKRSGISQGAISKVVNGQRNPGMDFCEGLSKALKLPVETVYKAAGLIPKGSESTAQKEELLHLFGQLPERDKKDLLTYIRFKISTLEQENAINQKSK